MCWSEAPGQASRSQNSFLASVEHFLKVNGPRGFLFWGQYSVIFTQHSLGNKQQVWKILVIYSAKANSLDKYHQEMVLPTGEQIVIRT